MFLFILEVFVGFSPAKTIFACESEQFDVKNAAGTPPQGSFSNADTWSSINEISGDITTVIPLHNTAGNA